MNLSKVNFGKFTKLVTLVKLKMSTNFVNFTFENCMKNVRTFYLKTVEKPSFFSLVTVARSAQQPVRDMGRGFKQGVPAFSRAALTSRYPGQQPRWISAPDDMNLGLTSFESFHFYHQSVKYNSEETVFFAIFEL